MKKSNRQNIADIVKAFGKINQDIHAAFDAMSEFLKQQSQFDAWKKDESGKKKTRKGYYDFTALSEGISNWYYLNFYGEFREKVVGFTFVIGVEHDENDENYLEFIQVLDSEINPDVPMLLIFGIYEVAGNIKKATVVNEDEYNYVDEVLRIADGWRKFDKDITLYNKWIDIDIEYEGEPEDYLEKLGWYKSAKVKINYITDISSKEKAEKYILELVKKAEEVSLGIE